MESVGGAFSALGKAAEGGRAPELGQDVLHSAFYRPWENGPSRAHTLALRVGEPTATWRGTQGVNCRDLYFFRRIYYSAF